MKIKCPVIQGRTESCNNDFINSTSLFRHLMDEHTDHNTCSYLAILLFKIHEKIEELEKEPYHPLDLSEVKGKHFLNPEDMPEICFVCVGHQETIIELKSLLD